MVRECFKSSSPVLSREKLSEFNSSRVWGCSRVRVFQVSKSSEFESSEYESLPSSSLPSIKVFQV